MTPDAELDRVLAAWLSGAGHRRAPDTVLRGTLEDIAVVRQRRPAAWMRRLGWAEPRGEPSGWTSPRRAAVRVALAAVLLVAVLLALAIGVGSFVTRDDRNRLPSASPALPSGPPATGWSTRAYGEDVGFVVDLPNGWTDKVSNADYVLVSGSDPVGTLSVAHASPFDLYTCTPVCIRDVAAQRVPWSGSQVLDDATAAISKRVGGGSWTGVRDGVVAGVTGARRLDVVSGTGAEAQRTTYVVGLDPQRIVALTSTQPVATYDATLVDRILATFRLLPGGPTYSIGTLKADPDPGGFYSATIPDFWPDRTVSVGGDVVAGLRRFGAGELTIGIGTPFGRVGVCDPSCRVATGQLTLADLRRTLMNGAPEDWARDAVELGGQPAERLRQTNPSRPELEHVFAIHDGRAVVVTLDLTSGLVSRASFDEMVAGFHYLAQPAPEPVVMTLTAPDGSFHVGLARGWNASEGTDRTAVYATTGSSRLAIFVGDASGMIQRCDRPAAPWEECGRVRVTTLDELVEATMVKPIADHGVGPPSGHYDEVVLDGERAVVVHIQAYEYPAKSGQELVYVLAMHDGRPYILRFWTSRNEFFGEEAVIAAFRFGR